MILLISVFGLFALEIFIACIFYPLRHGKIYYRLIVGWSGFVFKFDPEVGYAHKHSLIHQKPNKAMLNAPRRICFVDVRTDKNGFIFTEDLSTLKDKYRLIFCVGGSTTEGAYAPYNKTYPAVLDSFVEKHGYRCINAGVGGYRSIHELLFFKKKILPWKPWGIIIFSGYNDFEEPAYGLAKPYNPFTHSFSHALPTNRLETVLCNSALFHFSRRIVYNLLNKVRMEAISADKREKLKEALGGGPWLEEWKDNIGQIISLCKERGIKCYLLSHSAAVYKNAPQEAKDFAEIDLAMTGRFDIFVQYIDLIHKVSRELCNKKGAEFIDVTKEFDSYCLESKGQVDYKKRFSLFCDKIHFTATGNSLLGGLIYEKIKEDLA